MLCSLSMKSHYKLMQAKTSFTETALLRLVSSFPFNQVNSFIFLRWEIMAYLLLHLFFQDAQIHNLSISQTFTFCNYWNLKRVPNGHWLEFAGTAGRQVMNYYLPWLLADFFGAGRNSSVSRSGLENSPKTRVDSSDSQSQSWFSNSRGGFPNLRCLTVWSRRILWKYNMWVWSLNDHCSLFLREWDKPSN